MERLQKILARAGLASRREAERWIVEGRITVNGSVVRKLGSQADPAKDSIKVDGKRVRPAASPLYYAFHKPPGVITTLNDPEHRPDLTPYLAHLGEKKRVFPVGRLDYNTTGLLLLTNDGDLAYRLTHPANHVAKVYRVKVKGAVGDPDLQALRRGLLIDGRRTLPAKIGRISGQANSWLEVTLYEGRRNQIRRMFDRLGHRVQKLKRISIGPIHDRALKPGEWRRLSSDEIRRLREGT